MRLFAYLSINNFNFIRFCKNHLQRKSVAFLLSVGIILFSVEVAKWPSLTHISLGIKNEILNLTPINES